MEIPGEELTWEGIFSDWRIDYLLHKHDRSTSGLFLHQIFH